MSLMFTCREVVQTLSDFLERRMPFRERLRLRMHLWMCPICRRYFRQFRRIFRDSEEVDLRELPEDFEEVMGRVLRRWKGEPEEGDRA